MKLPKPNIIKPVVLLVPLLLASGNTQAEYLCSTDRDMRGATFGQIITPDPVTEKDRLYLTPERLAAMAAKRDSGDVHYTTMINVVNTYINHLKTGPERPAASALAYRINGGQHYIDAAKRQFLTVYGADPDFGWAAACDGNAFRTESKWAFMVFSWLYDEFTEEERAVMIKNFALWGEFWVNYVENGNEKGPMRFSDSDLVTELGENLTALGLILKGTELSERLLVTADKLFEEHIVPVYIQDIFAGGLWGEGPKYSAGTNVHWPLTFELNKVHRPDVYARYSELGFEPNKYFNDAIEALIHTTLPGTKAVYENGDVEEPGYFSPEDYSLIAKRIPPLYRSVANFGGLTDSEYHKKLANGYLNDLRRTFGDSTMNRRMAGVLEVLFQPSTIKPMSPQVAKLPLTFLADGTDTYTARTSWSDADASSLYMTADKYSVDHQNNNALHFDIARKGRWLTSDVVGYEGDSTFAIAHNTILIENPENYRWDLEGGRCEGCRMANLGDGDIIRQSESEVFNYVAGEAAQVHATGDANDPVRYVKELTRQIAHIKPDAYIVFDNVGLDRTQVGDFVFVAQHIDYATEYDRKVDLIQHFESEPVLDDEGFYVSGDIESGQQIKFQSLLPRPDNITTEIVDEKVYWSEVRPAPWYTVPAESRKWHIRISTPERQEDTQFLATLYAGDEGAVVTPTQQILLSKKLRENGQAGYIPSYSADVTGVALEIKDEWHVVIFNDEAEIDLLTLHYDVSFIPEGSIVNHYVLGAGSKERYSYEQVNGVYNVSERASTGTEMANNAGSLTVVTRDGVPFEDVEVPSVPQALVAAELNESELTIEWEHAIDKHVIDGADYTATSYAVYRSDVSLTEPVAVVRSKSFADSGLNAETQYSYSVAARDASGNESARSSVFSATTKKVGYSVPKVVVPGTGDKGTVEKTLVVPYPDITTSAFEEGQENDAIEGVYPAPGSVDVAPSEQLLIIDFIGVYSFIYSEGNFFITNLDTGEEVYHINPKHGAEDDQGNYKARRFALKLPAGTLEPDTNYGVTSEARFVRFQNPPYKMNTPIEPGVWTFKTGVETGTKTEPRIEPGFTPLTIEGTTPEILITDGGFETGTSMINHDHRTSGTVTDVNPIAGSYSHKLTLQTYGRARVDYVYPWGTEVHAKALQGYSQVRLPEAGIKNGTLNFCVVAYYYGSSERKDIVCETVIGEPGEVVKVEPVLNIDPVDDVQRLYAWYQYIGSESTVNVTVDDLNLVLHRTKAE